jgi:hypothetical protein
LGQQFAVEEAQMKLGQAETYARDCSCEAEKLKRYRARLEKRFFAEETKKDELEQDELGNTIFLNQRAGR